MKYEARIYSNANTVKRKNMDYISLIDLFLDKAKLIRL